MGIMARAAVSLGDIITLMLLNKSCLQIGMTIGAGIDLWFLKQGWEAPRMRNVTGQTFSFHHRRMNDRSGEFPFLLFMAFEAHIGPFCFQETFMVAGMRIMTLPADIGFVLKMLNRLLEDIFLLFMAGKTERRINSLQ